MPELRGERVHGQVEPPTDSSKPKRSMISSESACCASIGNGPDRNASSPLDRADLGDQRHELLLQLVEDRAHLGRLHPRLEVVEEDVVRLVVAVEAVDVAALQLDVALEVRQEEREVVLLRAPSPRRVRLGGGARSSRRAARPARGAPSRSRGASTRIRLASSES